MKPQIYTYVVEHTDSPKISANQNINDGKLTAVMFDDGLWKLEQAEDLLRKIREHSDDGAEISKDIDDYFG